MYVTLGISLAAATRANLGDGMMQKLLCQALLLPKNRLSWQVWSREGSACNGLILPWVHAATFRAPLRGAAAFLVPLR